MQTVTVRLAGMSYKKRSAPSVRDELQLQKLVKINTKSNGQVQWSVIQKQFRPKDTHCWGATTRSALRNLHKRRTKRNRYCHKLKQDEHEDYSESEYCEDNHEEDQVLLLSDYDFSDNEIDISPHFDGFNRVLQSNIIDYYNNDQLMLANFLDDLVKDI
jgi:hypothetical protein